MAGYRRDQAGRWGGHQAVGAKLEIAAIWTEHLLDENWPTTRPMRNLKSLLVNERHAAPRPYLEVGKGKDPATCHDQRVVG